MDDITLKEMWAGYDKKLEKSLALNYRLITEIQTQKARTALRPLKAIKIIAVVLGILWSLLLSVLVCLALSAMTYYRHFFVISALAVIIITVAAIIVYIKQIVLIQQIDNSMHVMETQRKLASLQSSTINITRILFLSAPFYTTFYINKSMFEHGTIGLWVLQLTVTTVFTIMSIWIYRNTRMENADKRWFKFIFGSSEWTSVTKAMNFLKEIDAYEKE
ncbi:hypothetical protein [Chitinophaga ginsengisoli]|uniref:Uncharacterized protein n=1 Tax=Chitinophaga ginsengisoli TaxID=363837 RepID=A0A2P8FL52_9BACT|nr:hypothetical protein [Chitinophaga ginsengisoli]PSL22441.1 hypothetical protein CLV42_12267 [Chitinophaga ginsengisoli]